MGPKFEMKYAEFYGDPNQPLIGFHWTSNQAHKDPMVPSSLSISGPHIQAFLNVQWDLSFFPLIISWLIITSLIKVAMDSTIEEVENKDRDR